MRNWVTGLLCVWSMAASGAEAVFAGGCFWCVEALYQETAGVSDVVSGVLAVTAAEGSAFGAWNIGTGRGLSVRQVVEGFGAALGQPVAIRQEASHIREVERQDLVADVTRLRALGWSPRTSFEDGLRDLLGR